MTNEKRTPWHDWRDWLIRAHGPEVGLWVARRVGRDIHRLGVHEMACSDNDRTADERDVEAMAKYEEAKASGCCGAFDKRYHHYRTNRKIWVGFNYGH